jgi:formamidopyrimidine-DNA glycosylase
VPELPEVETVARGLDSQLKGRRLRQVELRDPKLQSLDLTGLAGARIEGARRIGKRVALQFGAGRRVGWLLVHLRMSGVLFYAPEGVLPADRPVKHVRAAFTLDRGSLLFYDPRRFGTFDLYASAEQALPAGIDPFDDRLTPAVFHALLAGSSQPLKLWLLRQDRLVGLGNIYASEILYDCRCSPQRAAGTLDVRESARLLAATRRILAKAISHCGTTFSDFHNVNGEAGGFSRFLRVYGRAGQPCRRCGSAIVRVVQGQRSTFYCPGCQAQ